MTKTASRRRNRTTIEISPRRLRRMRIVAIKTDTTMKVLTAMMADDLLAKWEREGRIDPPKTAYEN